MIIFDKKTELIHINPNSYIYIYCPSNYATGGPEALHQLASRLRELGYQVFMYYFYHEVGNPVHASYVKYNVPFVDKIDNHRNNFLILPETFLDPVFDEKCSATKKIVWWLSVTNYQIVLDSAKNAVKHKNFYPLKSFLFPKKYKPLATINALKRKGVLNLAHSYFSLDFLKKNKMEIIGKISDYMSDSFYNKIANHVKKEDFVLYNPKKNGEYLERVKALCPGLSWKALINMSPDEVAHWMNKSKLYVDFGYHPGQERMPREAILMSCCVITGSQGSAAYQDDVPLPEGFKFNEAIDSPEAVANQIKLTLNKFEDKIKLFSDYKQKILAEKENFDQAVNHVFNKN